MLQLDAADAARVRPLFASLDNHLCIAAVIDGAVPGRVFVDERAAPRAAFVCTAEGHFLAGDASEDAFATDVRRYISDTILGSDGDLFLMLGCTADWDARVPAILRPRAAFTRERLHYTLTPAQFRPGTPVAGYAVRAIDAPFLAHTSLRNTAAIHDWIAGNWGDAQEFLRHGFGACVLDGDSVASYSLADCYSGERCETGIMTEMAHRRRGLATLAVAAAVERAWARGYTEIGWHCWADNRGSVAVAERVGFTLEAPYRVHCCFARESDHARWLAMRDNVAGQAE